MFCGRAEVLVYEFVGEGLGFRERGDTRRPVRKSVQIARYDCQVCINEAQLYLAVFRLLPLPNQVVHLAVPQ